MKYIITNEQHPCHLCKYEKNIDEQAENMKHGESC